MVLSLEQIKANQVAKIEKLNKRVKKLEGKKKRNHRLKRLYKVGLTTRVESSREEEDQRRMNDEDLFRVSDLDGDKVIVDVTAGENVEQDATVAEKEVSVAADKVVTTVESVKGITAATTPQISKDYAKDKGKGIMMKPDKPLKKKDQIAFDEEDDVQAIIDVDRQLAEQLNVQEREQLSIEERSKLLAELIESRRKYFAAKRAEDIKNKPPTKAQQNSLMCTYMKNIKGYKQKDFKGKGFDTIKKMFDKVYKRVNTFVAMDSEVMEGSKKTQAELTKGSSKRAGDEIKQESAKRQRADGNSQNYLTFGTMFKNFNKEDLEVLRSIMKERFKKTKPVNDMDNLLSQTLNTIFEHHVKDNIWKYQQGAVKVHNWKRYDSRGVYYVTTKNMVYYLLVEKMYLFTNNILHQLWKDMRLQVDYKVKIAYDLLRLIRRQINEGYISA
uniref:Uncharacterized protein n=1 Tax=Tanacetum cinerariifolium TaxID=118510 RepID=A0A699HA14_TANCI|nr:hypothetical protein [Tanacetum cinerariifolium]